MEDALKKQRQTEEDYHRFLTRLPATLNDADRQRIRSLSESVAALWHAPGTSAMDRKQIVRARWSGSLSWPTRRLSSTR